jgi:oligoendopeptidase F
MVDIYAARNAAMSKPNNPGITGDIDSTLGELRESIDEIHSSIDIATPQWLAESIRRIETLWEKIESLYLYSICEYSSDTTTRENQQLGGLGQKCYDESQAILRQLEFILGGVIQQSPSLLDAPVLSSYRHFLVNASKRMPYRLSDPEESLITAKDVNGISAIFQYRESRNAGKVFQVHVGGKERAVSLFELFSLKMDADRKTREAASQVYYGFFTEDKLLHGTALRAICSDHVQMTKLRKMPSSMTQSFLDQDVEESTIKALLETVERTSDSFQRFLQLKAQYYGNTHLLGYDIRAPWLSEDVWTYDWDRTKSAILRAYENFDDEIGDIVRGLFANQRIDSACRAGKAATAFCFPWFGGKTAFVFTQYNGILNDAYITAHELGHAVHSSLIFQEQTILNSAESSCMAETGSLFGELLLTEQLLKECENDKVRLEILAKVLDRFFVWGYHIGAYAIFEQSVYKTIEDGGHIDAEKACELWVAVRDRIYGDGIEWTENMEYDWAACSQLSIL